MGGAQAGHARGAAQERDQGVCHPDRRPDGRVTRGDFVFGYPITEKPRQQGESRPCFLAMPTKDWLPSVQRTIESAAKGFKCKLSVDNAAPGDIMNKCGGISESRM